MQTSRLFAEQAGLRDIVFLLLLGLSAGLINGLLGTGGGILLVFALSARAKRRGGADFLPGARDVYANALAVMLPVSLLSAGQYARAGAMDFSAFSPLLLPAVAGGVLGGWLLDRLKLPLIRRLFALLVLWSGLFMILRS